MRSNALFLAGAGNFYGSFIVRGLTEIGIRGQICILRRKSSADALDSPAPIPAFV
jgi:hypothetical protein